MIDEEYLKYITKEQLECFREIIKSDVIDDKYEHLGIKIYKHRSTSITIMFTNKRLRDKNSISGINIFLLNNKWHYYSFVKHLAIAIKDNNLPPMFIEVQKD